MNTEIMAFSNRDFQLLLKKLDVLTNVGLYSQTSTIQKAFLDNSHLSPHVIWLVPREPQFIPNARSTEL